MLTANSVSPSDRCPLDETALTESFLVKLRPLAFRFAQQEPRYDVDDYIQTGIEEVLLIMRRKACDVGYLYGVARMAMRRLASHLPPLASLDAPLGDSDEEDGGCLYDVLAAPPVLPLEREQLPHKTRALYAALYRLPIHHQKAVHEYYHLAAFFPTTREALTPKGVFNRYRRTSKEAMSQRRLRALETLRADARLLEGMQGGSLYRPSERTGATERLKVLLVADPTLSVRELATQAACSVSIAEQVGHKYFAEHPEHKPEKKARRIDHARRLLEANPTMSTQEVMRLAQCSDATVALARQQCNIPAIRATREDRIAALLAQYPDWTVTDIARVTHQSKDDIERCLAHLRNPEQRKPSAQDQVAQPEQSEKPKPSEKEQEAMARVKVLLDINPTLSTTELLRMARCSWQTAKTVREQYGAQPYKRQATVTENRIRTMLVENPHYTASDVARFIHRSKSEIEVILARLRVEEEAAD